MCAKRKRFSSPVVALFLVLCFLIGVAAGAFYQIKKQHPTLSDPFITGDLSIHFLEMGTDKTGDCTLIQIGTIDILVDAGATAESIPHIDSYVRSKMQDDVLDYVIVTHAHEDHYAGFATTDGTDSLFDLYQVGTIIDFPKTNQNPDRGLYKNYLRERSEEIASGATHYTAQQCIAENKATFELAEEVTLQILDSYYYTNEAESENDYSVCFVIRQDTRSFLFTGDLESGGEKKLLERNPDLGEVTLYKAGHHGSNTSSSKAFLAVISPEIVCVPCNAGSPEYTTDPAGQFPTQKVIDRISVYTNQVFVTTQYDPVSGHKSLNGTIVVTSGKEIKVEGSNHSLPLFQSDWFIQNRTMPSAWEKAA